MALLKYQAKSLIEQGSITTTHAKAKALARYMQKLVNWARKGDINALRQIRKEIDDRDLIKKLTKEILPKLPEDKGGEVSVFAAGQRRGDGSPLAVVRFNTGE